MHRLSFYSRKGCNGRRNGTFAGDRFGAWRSWTRFALPWAHQSGIPGAVFRFNLTKYANWRRTTQHYPVDSWRRETSRGEDRRWREERNPRLREIAGGQNEQKKKDYGISSLSVCVHPAAGLHVPESDAPHSQSIGVVNNFHIKIIWIIKEN